MGLLDTLKSKVGRHPDKASRGIDKAAETIDEKTGGKHRSHIDSAARKAQEGLGVRGEQREQPERAPEVTPDPMGEPPAGGTPGQQPPQPPQPQ